MLTALCIILYLAGIPVAAGVIGQPCGKADKAFRALSAILSWLGVALLVSITFAFVAWFRLYAVGRWIETQLARFTADL